jgi:hypothetical protein
LRSTSFSSSQWTPFHNFFWQSSFFHSLNMAIPLKLFYPSQNVFFTPTE